MRRMLAMLVTGLLLVSGTAVAAEQDAGKRALAAELLDLMHMKENSGEGMEMMKQLFSENSSTMRPEMAAKISGETQKMFDVISKNLSWGNLKDDYIDLYAETYTTDELKGIIAFYKTPAGQAFGTKQPELMKKGLEINRRHIMPALRAMQDERRQQRPAEPKTRKEKIKAAGEATPQEQDRKEEQK